MKVKKLEHLTEDLCIEKINSNRNNKNITLSRIGNYISKAMIKISLGMFLSLFPLFAFGQSLNDAEKSKPVKVDTVKKNIENKTLEDAIESLYNGEHEKAEKIFKEAIRVNPNNDKAYGYLGILHYDKPSPGVGGLTEEARSNFKKAIELNPNSALSYLGKGLILWWEKEECSPEEVQKEIEKALKIDSSLVPARYHLADMYNGTNPDLAIDEFIKIIKESPESSYAMEAYWEIIGGGRKRILSIFTKEVREKLAQTFYKRALETPETAANMPLLNRSSDLGVAIELNPDFAEAINLWTYFFINIEGRKDEAQRAIKLYKKTIELKPELVDAYYNLGKLFYDIKEFEKAFIILKKVQELQSGYKDAAILLDSIKIESALKLEDILKVEEDVMQDPIFPQPEIPNVAHIAGDGKKIYVGTGGDGFLVFNGKEWKSFTHENSNLPGDYITALETDKKGNVWLGVARSGGIEEFGDVGFETCVGLGLIKYDGNKFSIYNNTNSSLPSDNILDIDSWENILWVLTAASDTKMINLLKDVSGEPPIKLCRFDGKDWKIYDTPTPQLLMDIDEKGNIWAISAPIQTSSQSNVYKFDGKNWDKTVIGNELILHDIDAHKGKVVVVSSDISYAHGERTHMLENGKWTVYESRDTFDTFTAKIDRHGKIWIGNRHGLGFLENGRWYINSIENGMWCGSRERHERNDVHTIYIDSDNNLWLGRISGAFKPGGFGKFDHEYWTNFESMTGNDLGKKVRYEVNKSIEEK